MMEEDEDEDGVLYPEPAPPSPQVIRLTPFAGWVYSRKSDEIVEATIVGIRPNEFHSDTFEFVAMTCEDGQMYCEVYASVERDALPSLSTVEPAAPGVQS